MVLYGLPPAPTGKKGRPRKKGDQISLEEIHLSGPGTGDWLIGMMPVITNLWKGKTVYAPVTAPQNGKGGRRLFLCTKNPREISFDWEQSADETLHNYGGENIFYLPLGWYYLRWNIEVSYYEGKTFWFMEDYRLRSRKGIERLINLISFSYSAVTLLPYSDQKTRYEISQQIQTNIILCGFGKFLETLKKSCKLV